MNRFLISFLFCIYNSTVLTQDLPVQIQQQMENLASLTGDNLPEDDQYLQHLDHLKRHPVNVNTASPEQLQQLRILNALQIDHLMKYRRIFGLLQNIYELQAIPYWDVITIHKILPFIAIGPATSFKQSFLARLRGDQAILFRISRTMQKPVGYDTSVSNHYHGDRNHLLFRYRFQHKDLLYFGITGEKDAGEQFFKGVQSKGFDFYSFHLFTRKIGMIKSLALGDYTVNQGQGLIQWHSLGFSKSTEVMNIKRQAPVIMPYRAAGEFYFNRGMALTVERGRFEASVFASYRKMSANITDSPAVFSSLLTSGLYRNQNEADNKNKIVLKSAGTNITYRNSTFRAGLNLIRHELSMPMVKKQEPYNQFAFTGTGFLNSGFDYSYTYNNMHIFGEAAIDRGGNKAFLQGAIISVDPKIDVSMLFRYINKDYQSLFGNAFTENTGPVNEHGVYLGLSVRPGGFWTLDAYADFYLFPWLKYRVNAPSRGQDYMLQWNLKPNKQFELYARFRSEIKPINENGMDAINFPEGKTKQNLRIHFASQITGALELRSRIEMVWFDKGGKLPEEGFLVFTEAHYKYDFKWGGNLRLQYFETDSYNSRVYAYESDVLYGSSIPPSSETAFRYYFNLNYKPSKRLGLWLRWAHSIYNKELKELGSGQDRIPGNNRSELKFQGIYTF